MKRTIPGVVILNLALATVIAGAQVKGNASKSVSRPQIQAGEAEPSLIPNHMTTLVTLPGLHLTGAIATVSGVCLLKSYKVASDSEIRMQIEANRKVDDQEDGCFLKVRLGTSEVHTFVVVDLTEAEWNAKNAKLQADGQAKDDTYIAQLGKQWTLHFADGSSDTYTAQTASSGELPDFVGDSGITAKIATTDDGKVMIIAGSCIRSGSLNSGQVKDGTSIGECKPAGAWTAQMK